MINFVVDFDPITEQAWSICGHAVSVDCACGGHVDTRWQKNKPVGSGDVVTRTRDRFFVRGVNSRGMIDAVTPFDKSQSTRAKAVAVGICRFGGKEVSR